MIFFNLFTFNVFNRFRPKEKPSGTHPKGTLILSPPVSVPGDLSG